MERASASGRHLQHIAHAAHGADQLGLKGVVHLGAQAPLFLDGFITKTELTALQKAGAIAEVVGWAFDAEGRLIEGLTNERVMSAPLPSREQAIVVALAKGDKKLPGIRAALNRRLVNGLITDELTAEKLLKAR